MHHPVGDGIELDLAGDHARLGSGHVQFEQGGEEVAGIDVAL